MLVLFIIILMAGIKHVCVSIYIVNKYKYLCPPATLQHTEWITKIILKKPKRHASQ